jgi:hypothetical protein
MGTPRHAFWDRADERSIHFMHAPNVGSGLAPEARREAGRAPESLRPGRRMEPPMNADERGTPSFHHQDTKAPRTRN